MSLEITYRILFERDSSILQALDGNDAAMLIYDMLLDIVGSSTSHSQQDCKIVWEDEYSIVTLSYRKKPVIVLQSKIDQSKEMFIYQHQIDEIPLLKRRIERVYSQIKAPDTLLIDISPSSCRACPYYKQLVPLDEHIVTQVCIAPGEDTKYCKEAVKRTRITLKEFLHQYPAAIYYGR